jgi:uncharacterized protein YjbI with pentapeptide repeats
LLLGLLAQAQSETDGTARTDVRRAFLYASEFNHSRELAARTRQTIVFESAFANALARLELNAGEHRFCLDSSGEFFTGIVLRGGRKIITRTVLDKSGCVTEETRAGLYYLSLTHASEALTFPNIALVSIDRPGPPLLNSGGQPRKGFWAIVPFVQSRPHQAGTGRLRALPSEGGVMPVIGDLSSSRMDSYALWQFGSASPALLAAPGSVFDYERRSLPAINAGTVVVTNHNRGSSLEVIEREASTFQLRMKTENDSPAADLVFSPSLFSPHTLKVLHDSMKNHKPATFSLAFRFFPDGAEMDPLKEGEAALFQAADYRGKATVFPASTPSMAAFDSSAITIDRSATSIRLGPGTGVVLYSGTNYSGSSIALKTDSSQLSDPGTAASIRLTSLTKELLATHSCVNCNFEGIDLSGLRLSEFDLTGARLLGANLTDTRLNGAKLSGADLTNAILSCTDFSGTDSNHLNDLTHTNLTNVQIVPQASCRTNFSYTRLNVDALPPTQLKFLNLTGVHYERPPPVRSGNVPGPPLVNGSGFAVGGYWAIQPDPALDPSHRAGRLRATLPFQNLSGGNPSDNPNDVYVLADYSSQQMDSYSLFAFPPDANTDGSILEPGTFLNGFNLFNGPNYLDVIFLTVGQGYQCGLTCTLVNQRLRLTDLGNYRFNLGYYSDRVPDSGPFVVWSGGPPAPANALLNSKNMSPVKLRVMFRYFPDGTQIGNLAEGEVALFQQTGFKGKAAVFAADPAWYYLDQLTSDATTLRQTTQSVRLGNNTAVSWAPCHPHTCVLTDIFVGVVQDEDDVRPERDLFGGQESLSVQPLDQAITLFLQRRSFHNPFFPPLQCTKCKLANANFSDIIFQKWDLSGATLAGATLSNVTFNNVNLTGVRFDGATLSNVKVDKMSDLRTSKFTGATLSTVTFNGSDLRGVDFSGAVLTDASFAGAKVDKTTILNGAKATCVNLSGPDQNHIVDLTGLDLSQVQWLSSQSCRSNFSYTKLSVTQVPPAMWKNMNLTGAVFVDLNPNLSSQEQPLDLTGAMLGGMSLQNVVLDYAVMAGADLTGTLFNNASLQHVNLSGAKLYSSHLNNVNLDGANMSGAYLTKTSVPGSVAANLQGAFLRNVNLSQAKMSGANFTNASFYSLTAVGEGVCTPDSKTGFTNGCATASSANMDGTIFNDAYLSGVDFSSVKVEGVNFGNAYLAGADFKGATLSVNSNGTDTGFTGAFLQGANLQRAVLLNGVSLDNAYVDFTAAGNIIYLQLSGQHTTFAGYWHTPGEPVCAEMVYNNPTTPPPTDQATTCPNGSQNVGGCGPTNSSNLNWKSPVDISTQASYKNDSTYTKAAQAICTADLLWNLGKIPGPTAQAKSRGENK